MRGVSSYKNVYIELNGHEEFQEKPSSGTQSNKKLANAPPCYSSMKE
jgi:hypothetical protein